jgi:hypothetical protein
MESTVELPNFCKNCMYCEAYQGELYCSHKKPNVEYDLVTGNMKMPLCYSERYHNAECGPEGKMFSSRFIGLPRKDCTIVPRTHVPYKKPGAAKG